MPDPSQAEKQYRSGMELYARGEFPQAIDAFDRALSLGNGSQSYKLLDAKAATLNRMGDRQAAFDLAASLCKKHGDKNARPWYRVAAVLSDMGTYDAAERSITKGISLATTDAVRKTLTALRTKNSVLRAKAQANLSPEEKSRKEAAAKAKMCFTHLLPYDVLILVAQAGLVSDPDIALRMSGVCTEWRQAMFNYSPLWTHLRVGKRRPTLKIDFWKERSKDRLREITLLDAPSAVWDNVFPRLIDDLAGVERLVINVCPDSRYIRQWKHKFRVLKSLIVHAAQGKDKLWSETLGLDLIHPEACTLEVVDINCMVAIYPKQGPPDEDGTPPRNRCWMHSNAQLQCLRKLHIAEINVTGEDNTALTLLENTARISELCFGITTAVPAQLQPSRDPLPLEELTRLELRGMSFLHTLIPPELELPNLQHFSTYNWVAGRGSVAIDALRNTGVSWSKLISLEFGRLAPVSQRDLLELLPLLTSLRFLSIPFHSDVDNTLIEALVVDDSKTPLLPNLVALSIAGNDNISAGPIRRMVLSRNAPEKLTRAAAPAPERKRSAFAPARKDAPAPKVAASSSTPRPLVAKMTWLCLDCCNNPHLDDRVLGSIRPYLQFLTAHSGGIVNARIRGQGLYNWDRPEATITPVAEATSSAEKRRAEAGPSDRAAKRR